MTIICCWQQAGSPDLTPAQECVIQAARSGASFSSQASVGSVGGGPPPCQTPPSRHRLRSGSEAVERHVPESPPVVPSSSALPGPRHRGASPSRRPWSHISVEERDGEPPFIERHAGPSRSHPGLLKPALSPHTLPPAGAPYFSTQPPVGTEPSQLEQTQQAPTAQGHPGKTAQS